MSRPLPRPPRWLPAEASRMAKRNLIENRPVCDQISGIRAGGSALVHPAESRDRFGVRSYGKRSALHGPAAGRLGLSMGQPFCALSITPSAAAPRTARRACCPGVAPVLGADAAVQRLDDLPADRQAQAGMLAELLALRPLGVEPVEDVLQLGLGNAGPLVLDGEFHLAAGLAGAQPDAAVRRAERLRIADQVAQHLHQPVLDRPGHHAGRRHLDQQPRPVVVSRVASSISAGVAGSAPRRPARSPRATARRRCARRR